MVGVSKAITEKGAEGDEMARIIIMFSLERDLRDFMSGKISAASAAELWNGIKKAKKVLVSSRSSQCLACALRSMCGMFSTSVPPEERSMHATRITSSISVVP